MLLFRRTVDSIVADIDGKVQDLLALSETLQRIVKRDNDKIASLEVKIKTNLIERDRAEKVARNLEKLIGG